MKKLLLGTTTIVGVSFMASAAMAKPEIRVGGFFDFQVGIVSQEIDRFGNSPGGVGDVDGTRGYGFLNDSEVIVRASDKMESGLRWAVKIEIETSEDEVDDGDETDLTLSGTWGQLVLGDFDGPVDTMKMGGKRAVSNAGTGGIGGQFRRWVGHDTANSSLWSNAEDLQDTSDSIKIAYYTPRIAGFQAGASFTPNSEDISHDRTSDSATDSVGAESFENWWELGIGYDQKFDQFRIRASAVASLADAQDDAAFEDIRSWNVGLVVGFGGFSVGAGYGTDGDGGQAVGTGNDDVSGWSLGVGYNIGAWDFGLGYYKSEAGANTAGGGAPGAGDDEIQVVTLGTTYDMGSGLSVYGELVWFETESANDSTLDNDGTAIITGIEARF